MNILVVDDNQADVTITLRAFGKVESRDRIEVVGNGQECLDYLQRQGTFSAPEDAPRPDLILMDVNMPVMDGFAALRAIKTDEDLKVIPVIMLTASNNEVDVEKSFELGANGYIQKPVDYEEFVNVIDELSLYWHRKEGEDAS